VLLKEWRNLAEDPSPGRFIFPRSTRNAHVSGQPLAATHGARAGEDRLGLGNVPGSAKDKCEPIKKYGVDPKVASDQRGHGIGVSMEVYTNSDIERKRAAVNKLEAAVLRKRKQQRQSVVR